jgi:N-acylneuraminate cytidylyltransferase
VDHATDDGVDTLMVVPARGGSKAIPRKNVEPIAGRPLAVWVVAAGIQCAAVDRVVLATDDREIASTVRAHVPSPKLRVFWRSPESATDTASSESVVLEVLAAMSCRRVVMAQPTSPMLRATDLTDGLARMDAEEADSVVSVVRQRRFIWQDNADGGASPLNYNPADRPRRQDFDGILVENGAFYIANSDGFRGTGTRLFGRVVAHEMPEDTYLELDEPDDWPLVETLLRRRLSRSCPDWTRIRLVLSDIDGVLTDGGMYYSEQGDELKKFSTYDGLGIARLRAAGLRMGLITREDRDLNRRRADKLGVDVIEQGATDKVAVVERLLSHYGLAWDAVAYIGDDIHDVDLMQHAGLSAAPASAMPAALAAADHRCSRAGGDGCLREFAEIILGSDNEAVA